MTDPFTEALRRATREEARREWGNGGQPSHRILTGDAFVGAFEPPDWLIDGILQKGRLYACTSLTAHGKTAVWLYFACMVHAGRSAAGRDVEPGNVLYLAGENPQDLQARMLGMARHYSIPSLKLPFVLPHSFPLDDAQADTLKDEIIRRNEPLALLIGDTAASFFPGDDENDNVAAGRYARTLRSFTELPGNPAVLVLTHPVKNAAHDNLLPRGGSAFLNELDGNTSLWSNELGEQTTLHWTGKIRGPDFNPLPFQLLPAWTGLLDKKNRQVMTILAKPLDDLEIADRAKQTVANEDAVLRAFRANPKSSLTQIAAALGWLNNGGEPLKAKVQRAANRLKDLKFLEQPGFARPYKITPKGEKYLSDEGLI